MIDPTAAIEPVFLTARQICQKYNLTRSTLTRWTTSFNSPSVVLISPRILRYDAVEFDRWFRSHSNRGREEAG
jgi:predicted DNA-binding transcriptional regulator AlpA